LEGEGLRERYDTERREKQSTEKGPNEAICTINKKGDDSNDVEGENRALFSINETGNAGGKKEGDWSESKKSESRLELKTIRTTENRLGGEKEDDRRSKAKLD